MPIDLKETVVSTGGAFRGTRAQVPDYLQRAIAESAQRGKDDARTNNNSESTTQKNPHEQKSK